MKHKPDEETVMQRKTAVKITPEMATHYLDKSKGNRKLRERTKLMSYVKDMERGAWLYNGDAIRFSEDGVLLDGHHRLTACEKSGVPLISDIVVIPSESIHTIDKGASRSEADSLVMEYGYEPKRAQAAVTAVSAIIQHDAGASRWSHGGGTLQYRVTHHEVARWIDENESDLGISMDFAFSIEKAHRLISQGFIACLHYLGCRAYGRNVTEDFLQKVLTGHYIEPNTTAEHVRTTLLMARSGQIKTPPFVKIMTVAKGLRSVASGRNIKHRSNAIYKLNSDNPVFLK